MAQTHGVFGRSTAERQFEGLHRPLLLPLVSRVEPEYASVEAPGMAELIIAGVRVRLRADGRFDVGSGILPLARSVQVLKLPERLSGGVLFALSTPENTWLMRADSFASRWSPLGKLEVPTSAVSLGFDAIYATIKSTGIVVAIDPRSANASETTLLPPAPEYGDVAIVDDWFGAYLDPLRGLMLTHDAGQNWQPFFNDRLPSSSTIRGLSADSGRLRIQDARGRVLWLSRRGELRDAHGTEIREEPTRSVHGWFRRMQLGPFGGWPIELAVTRGALIRPGVALVLTRGLALEVRLRDGAIIASKSVHVDPDRVCHAVQVEKHVYFVCSGARGAQVHRWTKDGSLERLIEFPQARELVAATDGGLLWRGACEGTAQAKNGHFCALRPGKAPTTLELPIGTGRERVALIDHERTAILRPPTPTHAGELMYVGAQGKPRPITLPADCSPRQREILTTGWWLKLQYVAGVFSTWVSLGDDLIGVRLDLDGKATVGELVSGASRAVLVEDRVFLPNSSGFALESLDGGFTYQRPPLPISLALTDDTQRHASAYGCTRVGCRLNQWLRVGWSEPSQPVHDSDLESLSAPEPIHVQREQRRISRINCYLRSDRTPEALAPMTIPPSELSTHAMAFERSWHDERMAVLAHTHAAQQGGPNSWFVRLRVSDPLHRRSSWSATASAIQFDSLDAAARAFAHPKQGANATSWLFAADPDGDGILWAIDEPGRSRMFLVESDRGIQDLTRLTEREPRRITDVAHLADGWYLLGTAPKPGLVVINGDQQRVVSDWDPRSRLRASRLRMVKNRDRTRVAYLVQSARLRAVDVKWFVYPVHARNGTIEAPIVIPADKRLRACDPDQDGWLITTSLDVLASVAPIGRDHESATRTDASLMLSESGICIERLLVHGSAPKLPSQGGWRPTRKSAILGDHLDDAGVRRPMACEIID